MEPFDEDPQPPGPQPAGAPVTGDADRWRRLDESDTDPTGEPDMVYTGPAFRLPEA